MRLEDSVLRKVAQEYGSPTFLFDIDELKERVETIRAILAESGKKINLCYSIKANPFLIPYINDFVDNFEVCSPGELEIIRHYNIAPGKIIYSGVNKGTIDVKAAVEYGCSILTAESKRHYQLIKEAANESDTKVNVILRLTSGNQFGMSIEDIRDVLGDESCGNVKLVGLHYFAGTGRNNPKPQEKELNKLSLIFSELRDEYGIELKKLEYGPGLPYPYFINEDFSDTLLPLRNVAGLLSEMADKTELTIEMGRFIASSCGYYISTICDLKRYKEQNWCILDGGLNHVNYYGQMMGMKVPVIRNLGGKNSTDSDDRTKNHLDINNLDINNLDISNLDSDKLDEIEAQSGPYALCGSLCTSNDILVREYELTKPAIGDILVFEHLGAYSITEGINLFLSRDMPKVLAYREGRVEVLRDALHSWELNCRK